jgi:hypothetical protein
MSAPAPLKIEFVRFTKNPSGIVVVSRKASLIPQLAPSHGTFG